MAQAPGHPCYRRLNELLARNGFDRFVEELCPRFYHAELGRPGIPPGVYFRMLLIGYFEGLDSERGIAWRVLARKRKNKASNDDWESPADPDARITKMKDGRTRLTLSNSLRGLLRGWWRHVEHFGRPTISLCTGMTLGCAA